jgi:hypothetical protein
MYPRAYETGLRFYTTIGFEANPYGPKLTELGPDEHAFLVQGVYVKERAEHMVMHVLVKDVHAWWQHLDSLDLAKQFGVTAPAPPRVEPWGLTVTYVTYPSCIF